MTRATSRGGASPTSRSSRVEGSSSRASGRRRCASTARCWFTSTERTAWRALENDVEVGTPAKKAGAFPLQWATEPLADALSGRFVKVLVRHRDDQSEAARQEQIEKLLQPSVMSQPRVALSTPGTRMLFTANPQLDNVPARSGHSTVEFT